MMSLAHHRHLTQTALTVLIAGLLVPPTLFCLFATLAAVVAASPALIGIQGLALFGFRGAWRLALQTYRRRPQQVTRPDQISYGLLLLYAGVLIIADESGHLGPFPSLYYLATGPILCVIACLGCNRVAKRRQPPPAQTERSSVTVTTRLWSVAAKAWLSVVVILILLSMIAATGTHSVGYAAQLISPLNWQNWCLIALLSAPAFLPQIPGLLRHREPI